MPPFLFFCQKFGVLITCCNLVDVGEYLSEIISQLQKFVGIFELFSFIRLYLTILYKVGRNLKGILQQGNFWSNDNSVNDKISILKNFCQSFIGTSANPIFENIYKMGPNVYKWFQLVMKGYRKQVKYIYCKILENPTFWVWKEHSPSTLQTLWYSKWQ